MRDATYLREQAKLCLEIAGQMSDRKIADGLHISVPHSGHFGRSIFWVGNSET